MPSGVVRNALSGGIPTSGTLLPRVYGSVQELRVPALFPERFAQWFAAYVPGQTPSVLNGMGGAAAAVLCIAGILLLLSGIRKNRIGTRLHTEAGAPPARTSIHAGNDALIYLCVLGVFLAGCLYAVRFGSRFLEHLSVPAGFFTAIAANALVQTGREKPGNRRLSGTLFTIFVCGAVTAVPVLGAVNASRQVLPAVSRAYDGAMEWIRENSRDPEAVIASWWDKGYYYEYASGHPVLWDGGSQSAVRSILIGKALTTEDMELSAAILSMLAGSGDRAVIYLAERLGVRQAFACMFDVLPLEKEDLLESLESEYAMTREDAEEAEKLLHPGRDKEIWLVLTDRMLEELGWIEYYAGWDCRRERGQSKRDATGLEPAVLRWTGNLSVNARGRHPSKTHERPRLWKVQGSHGTYMARAPGRAGGGRQTSDQECGRVLQGLGLRTGGAQGQLGGRRVPGCPMPREPRCAVLGGQGSCHQ